MEASKGQLSLSLSLTPGIQLVRSIIGRRRVGKRDLDLPSPLSSADAIVLSILGFDNEKLPIYVSLTTLLPYLGR